MDVWKQAPEIFETMTAVAEFVSTNFVTSEGKPVSARTVRGHMQGRGKKGKLLFPRPGGGYDRSDVADYIGRMGYAPADADPVAPERGMAAKKLELEIAQQVNRLERQILQNKELEFRLGQTKKEFVRAADLDAELSARGLAVRHHMERQLTDKVGDLFSAGPDGAVAIMMDCVDQALHEYVSMDSFYVVRVDQEGEQGE